MSVETSSTQQPHVNAGSDSPDNKQPNVRVPAKFRVIIYDAWCKKCGICVEFCPKGVLAADELGTPHSVHRENCIGCTQCVLHCPDFAISVSKEDAEVREK